MLYYDKTNVFEGIHVNNTSKTRECDICHYWYFLDKGLKFQRGICSCCHDALMILLNLSDIAILNIHVADLCCIISGISKSEARNLMQNIDLTEKSGAL